MRIDAWTLWHVVRDRQPPVKQEIRHGPVSTRVTLSLLTLLAGPSILSAAEQPALPIEFAVTDSIVMTDRDELYISPTFQYFRLPDQKRLTIGAELAYGFTDQFQITTFIPYEVVRPDADPNADGIGDVGVTARYALLDYRERPFGLDLGLGVVVPSGDRKHDLGEGKVTLAPSFTASWWIGHVNLEVNASWGHALRNDGTEPNDEGEYNVALVYPIQRWFAVLEGNGESNRERTKYYLTPEVVWKATENLELLLAVPCPVTAAAGDYGVVAGFTVEFEHLLRRGGRD
jgi:hypothetical protein